MADISKILTEAWLKVNEGIGSAANSIADATKEKVNEINLNSRRSEVLNQLVPKIVEIYRSGATLPEELTTILKELTDIEDQLAALKPAPATKAPVMEVPEEKNEEAPAAPQDDMEQADSDEDVPVIQVDTEDAPEPVEEAPEEPEEVDYDAGHETASCENCQEESLETDDETDHGFEEAASTIEKMANEGETEQSEEKDEAKEAQMKFDVDDVIEGLGKAADKVADAAKYAAENPEKVIDKAADVAGKVAETIGKAADKALDQAQKVIDKTDKSANSASDQVGKVVDGIGKAAEKAANAFTSFLENLTRNDSDKK